MGARWYSLDARQGSLRLFAQAPAAGAANPLREAAILSQRLPARAFTVGTRLQLDGRNDGDRAGLLLNGLNHAWLGLRRAGERTQLMFATCDTPAGKCQEQIDTVLADVGQPVYLRMRMKEGGVALFSYSLADCATVEEGGFVDVDYFRVGR